MADRHPQLKTLDELLAIMRALRAPETGCPWDLKQSFATIAPYTIEEAYEVADAIRRGDRDALKEELGDLLLQVVYHAHMAEEDGQFAFPDVVDGIARKMIRRHPHLFSDPSLHDDPCLRDAFEPERHWEQIKDREKARAASISVLENVPLALPALARAQKLQAKAARVGFDWPDLASTFAKVEEEVDELREALGSHDAAAEEIGDLFFALVNVARKLGADAEALLRDANAKFERRFATIEAGLTKHGRTPSQASLAEMDALWEEAKRRERQAS